MCCCLQDIRKRINAIPDLGKLAKFVAIPTTSGTGSEVTPFAVVTDEKTGIKYPLADYALVSCCCWVEHMSRLHGSCFCGCLLFCLLVGVSTAYCLVS
jgi:hypothetical protein